MYPNIARRVLPHLLTTYSLLSLFLKSNFPECTITCIPGMNQNDKEKKEKRAERLSHQLSVQKQSSLVIQQWFLSLKEATIIIKDILVTNAQKGRRQPIPMLPLFNELKTQFIPIESFPLSYITAQTSFPGNQFWYAADIWSHYCVYYVAEFYSNAFHRTTCNTAVIIFLVRSHSKHI